MEGDYYSFISIEPTATAEEIKRACFKRRRALAVARDQKGQEYLNEIIRTLQDERARAEYDALRLHGQEISRLTDEILTAKNEERTADAIRLLKRLLVFVPGQAFASNQLGICYADAGDFYASLRVYEQLVKDHADVAVYWANFGHVLNELAPLTPLKSDADAGLALCPECLAANSFARDSGMQELTCAECQHGFLVNTHGNREQVLRTAQRRLTKALSLEPYNASFHMAMADSYELGDDYRQAVVWAEKAIVADGKTDLQDLEAFFYIARLYCRQKLWGKVRQTAERIAALLPDDGEAWEYAGYRFAQIAFDLGQVGMYDAAATFAEAGLIFLPDEADIQGLASTSATLHQAWEESQRMRDDHLVVEPMKDAAMLFLFQASGRTPDAADDIFQSICDDLDYYERAAVHSSYIRLSYTYSSLYALGQNFFDSVDDVACGRQF